MIIDSPHVRHIPALRELWQEAFGDSDALLDGFFHAGFSPERSRCLWLKERLAAALYWFDCRLGEKKLAYVYAVATDKAFRGRGLCTALMQDTHRHLAALGYDGAVLVPGSEGLFALYEKLGYWAFCPMEKQTIGAFGSVGIRQINAADFARLRPQYLPEEGILQEGPTLSYLQTFARFYEGESFLACASLEGNTLYFQEYLGDHACLPGMIAALGAEKGIVCITGKGSPTAMYYPLGKETRLPGYFGLSLG